MTRSSFDALLALVARLRAPGGCAWDRAQTHTSLKGALLEEAWEVVAEIEADDPDGLRDELGDLLLHVVFHAQIAAESGRFTAEDVIAGLTDKLMRRHPHVFGDARADTPEAVVQTWNQVKAQEGAAAERPPVARHLPALLAARKWQDAQPGAPTPRGAPDPERLGALLDPALPPGEALGALLFAAVALARARGVDPEFALAQTVAAAGR